MEKLKRRQQHLMILIQYEVGIIESYIRVITDINEDAKFLEIRERLEYSKGLTNLLNLHKSELAKLKAEFNSVMLNIDKLKVLNELRSLQRE